MFLVHLKVCLWSALLSNASTTPHPLTPLLTCLLEWFLGVLGEREVKQQWISGSGYEDKVRTDKRSPP